MRKLFVLLVAVVFLAAVGSAAVIPQLPACTGVNALTLDGWAGCTQGDKVFANFTYSPGTSGVAAADVSFSEEPTVNQHSVLFTGSAGSNWLGAPSVGSTVLLGYDVFVNNVNPNWAIIAADIGSTNGVPPPPDIVVTKVLTQFTGGALIGTLASINGSQTYLTGINITQFHVAITANIGAGRTLNQVSDDYYQADTSIPEPVTMALFGSGLLALGLVRRFRRS